MAASSSSSESWVSDEVGWTVARENLRWGEEWKDLRWWVFEGG